MRGKDSGASTDVDARRECVPDPHIFLHRIDRRSRRRGESLGIDRSAARGGDDQQAIPVGGRQQPVPTGDAGAQAERPDEADVRTWFSDWPNLGLVTNTMNSPAPTRAQTSGSPPRTTP